MKKRFAAVALTGLLAVSLAGCDAKALQGLLANNQDLVKNFLQESGLTSVEVGTDSGYYQGDTQEFRDGVQKLANDPLKDPSRINGRWDLKADLDAGKTGTNVRYGSFTVAEGKFSGEVYLYPGPKEGVQPMAGATPPGVIKAFSWNDGTFKDGQVEVKKALWNPEHSATPPAYTVLRGVFGQRDGKPEFVGFWEDYGQDGKPMMGPGGKPMRHPFRFIPAKQP